jgi:hypothetical protein
MNRRIHDCMDGALPREALTPAEAVELSATEELFCRAGATLRSVPVPDLTARVAARVEALRPAPSPLAALAAQARAAAGWLLVPRTVRVRPAFGMAAAFALALLLALPYAPGRGTPEVPAVAAGEGTVLVQFRLDAPGAQSVSLAGTFTGWETRVELYETAPGVWSARVPVTPGIHDYLFIVDGEWTADPAAPSIPDGFGGTNSRLLLSSATST